jgi:hypothetical protein
MFYLPLYIARDMVVAHCTCSMVMPDMLVVSSAVSVYSVIVLHCDHHKP